MDHKAVIRKIKSCIEMANNEAASQAESELAMRMATSLMKKHNIENTDLIDVEEMIVILVGHKGKRLDRWHFHLAWAVSKLFECKVDYDFSLGYEKNKTVKYKQIKYCGFETDVEVAKWMFEFLFNNIKASADNYAKQNKGQRNKKSVKVDFERNMVFAICAKIEELIEQKNQEYRSNSNELDICESTTSESATSGSSKNMIAFSKSKMLRINEEFGETKVRNKVTKIRASDAALAGKLAGDKVQLNTRGVENNAKQVMRLA